MVLILRRLFNTLRCQGRAKNHSSSIHTLTKSKTGIFPAVKRWKAQEKKNVEEIPRLGMIPRRQLEEDVDTLMMSMTILMTPQPSKVPQFNDDVTDTIPELQATGSFSDDSTISEQSFSSMSEYSNEDSNFVPKQKAAPSKKNVTFLLPDWDVSSKSFLQPTRCGSLMLGVMPQIDEEASDCYVADGLPEIRSVEEETPSSYEEAVLTHEESSSSCKNSEEVAGCLRNNKDVLFEKPSPWFHMVGSMQETTQDLCCDESNNGNGNRCSPFEDDEYPSDEEDGMDEDEDNDDDEETSSLAMAPVVTSRSLVTGRLSVSNAPEEFDDCPFDEISDHLQVELFR